MAPRVRSRFRPRLPGPVSGLGVARRVQAFKSGDSFDAVTQHGFIAVRPAARCWRSTAR